MYAVIAIAGRTVVVFGPFRTLDLAEAWQVAFEHDKEAGPRSRTTYEVVPILNPGGSAGICSTPPPPLESI